ncbi:MAG: DUF2848 domain-containing protein [Pseudomonadota bacterium]
MPTLSFETPHGPMAFAATRCLVAGWTGRDPAAVQHHIDELAAIGVAPPSETPLYYRVPAALLTQAAEIEVLSAETGGEAEPVILDDGDRLWLTLGSDHTDRGLETTSVAHSKAVAAKPLALTAWPLESVADRLDSLRLIAVIDTGAGWTRYQDGTLAAMLPLMQIVAQAPEARPEGLGQGTAMFCGTIPALGGVRPTPRFRASLLDPATGAEIVLAYTARTLPVVA